MLNAHHFKHTGIQNNTRVVAEHFLTIHPSRGLNSLWPGILVVTVVGHCCTATVREHCWVDAEHWKKVYSGRVADLDARHNKKYGERSKSVPMMMCCSDKEGSAKREDDEVEGDGAEGYIWTRQGFNPQLSSSWTLAINKSSPANDAVTRHVENTREILLKIQTGPKWDSPPDPNPTASSKAHAGRHLPLRCILVFLNILNSKPVNKNHRF